MAADPLATQPTPAASPFSTAGLLWRLTRLAWEYQRPCLGLILLHGLLAALTLGGLTFTGLGIDYLRSQVSQGPAPVWPSFAQPPQSWSPAGVIAWTSGWVLLMAALVAALKYAAALLNTWLSQKIVVRLRTDVFAKLQELSFRFYDAQQSSRIINRVTADIQAVRGFIDSVLIRVVTVLISLAVYAGYMWSMHPPLTAACLLTTPVLWLGAVWFSRTTRGKYLASGELSDQLVARVVENVQSISVIKAFGREADQIAGFRESGRKLRDQKFDIFWTVSLYQPIMGWLTQLNMLVLIGYGGYLVIRGELPLGAGLFVFANLLQEFSAQIGQITNIANSIQASLTGAERVFEVLDEREEITNPAIPLASGRATGHLRFELVTFQYATGEPVLRDVSFVVAPGERLGIMGEMGAGKTTLLALLARFYDPVQGRVLLDGIDLRDWNLVDLRSNLGLVFQESFLFSNTVAANVAFGKPGARLSEVEQATHGAAANEFVEALPEQYHSLVGEQGSQLSGGQRQRLALARALLLNPSILLLDEATSAVDPDTEARIEDSLTTSLQQRTVILVSSRISTLRRCDRILVLHRGELVETGTHDELMAQRGNYWSIAGLQGWSEQTGAPV